jgi:hypothetical protein
MDRPGTVPDCADAALRLWLSSVDGDSGRLPMKGPKESNRMSKEEVKRLNASGEVADFSPKQWENKIRQLLVEAKNAKTIDGWWRDLDRSNPTENKRRMRGMLDFTAFLSVPLGGQLEKALPLWKRQILFHCPAETTFTIYLEAKTGRGKPNAAQEVSINRANRNPGAHAFVVYPGSERC